MTAPDPTPDEDPGGIRARIRTLREDGDPATALALLDGSRDRLPAGFARRERARLLHRLDRPAEALAELDRGRPAPGTDALRLRLLIALGRRTEATALVDAAPADPDAGIDPRLILTLARDQLQAGQFATAARLAARVPTDAAQALALRALLLAGAGGDEIARVLPRPGAETDALLLAAIRRARADLDPADPDSPVQALLAGVAAALPLFSDPQTLFQLRRRLCDIADARTDRLIWDRTGVLERDRAPASYRDVPGAEGPPAAGAADRLRRFAAWLDLPPDRVGDWIGQAHDGRRHQHRLRDLFAHSRVHFDEFAADIDPLDWSAVRACAEAGQPVLLAAAHHSFIPALLIQMQRAKLDIRVIAGGWAWGPESHLAPLFIDAPAPLTVTGALPQPPASALRRGLIGQLRAGGAALVAIDTPGAGARPVDLPAHGVRALLPPPLWSVARKTGAAAFVLECTWAAGRIRSGLTPWPVPAEDGPEADALWYEMLLTRARAAALRDPRNVAQPGWLIDLL
ncbi:hypothetical protein QO034_15775 [Sedimentitalea sp. JM2-8]|uniref:Uncharacterized protein n=1 Tax=Sedimentitalea xiamensis TaxID=3050037 RepID=A0ABT7FHF6_9RHOB|nr:hypothetical protein [Sedimentitalea xiamensis]MDK3074557.1 hypothetical protein [Sedimentitalea xiamensis]